MFGFRSALADVRLTAVDQIVQISQNNAGVKFHLHTLLLSFGVEHRILCFELKCKEKFVKTVLNLKNGK